MSHHAPLFYMAGAVATLVCGAAVVCGGRDCAPETWDLRVLDWFATHRTPVLDGVFFTVTWLGSLWVLLPLALALIAGLAVQGRIAIAASIAAAFGGAVAMSYAAKLWVGRERPPTLNLLISMPADPSFPSGHAMQITAFALAVAWMLAPPSQRGLWLAVALALILLVGVSRVYLQVHFPSDVLAGTLAAALWSCAVAARHRKQAWNQRA
jgi:undecaprenyl-diphosphatase